MCARCMYACKWDSYGGSIMRHTKDINSDVDVFLSRLVLGGDGEAS